MKFPLRRVVTGHDEKGMATVQFDDISTNLVPKRPGHNSFVVWTTKGAIDNSKTNDAALEPVGTELKDGTVFRIMKLDPGVAPRRHRTNSVDYLVVLSGSVSMELDNDEVVELKAGDVLVQRGTVHNWVNKGTEPCIMAVVLVSAPAVQIAGQTLEGHG